MTNYTQDQIDHMRAVVSEADQKAAALAAEAREAFMRPIKSLLSSEEFKKVYEELKGMVENYTDEHLSVHVQALVDIMPRLATSVGMSLEDDAKALVGDDSTK